MTQREVERGRGADGVCEEAFRTLRRTLKEGVST
jgi:hypothetical protein